MWKDFVVNFVCSIIICFVLCVSFLQQCEKTAQDSTEQPIACVTIENVIEDEIEAFTEPVYAFNSDAWNDDDKYLLAKIAMAEAEGCDTRTKMLVIATVLNRVESNDFPDTIREVIYENRLNQNGKRVYQFTPIGNGRFDSVEPNEDCWIALSNVMEAEHDFSEGSLFFESCSNDNNWHSRNLILICKSGGVRFYK